ncbi:SDR family NAD(P)-dependent oxidoreductase [Pleionea mediterranea]|uniref:NAD(P)-dependent dehydrogenase (Short-subunit alcohol dehydrogenase family) n=1 Tax=Pleionea mediterranea TaxID=523701 RepID=A0A316FY96_9GAMM|nr:SDR family NAD(P)-dependent oxidoreductase [Pleionea mediterranea]PWK53393.1 NAD(P)-dependent dehydrogenase (short-subunit alcohol dehydrogenase family) [Pleionea mediterranea]
MNFSTAKAIVSGGASGLGAGIAKAIIDAGGQVALLDINAEQGESYAKELGDRALFIKTDISNESNVVSAVDTAAKQFGGINLAVGCAGVLGNGKLISKKGPMPAEFFQKVVDINLVGSFLLTREAAKHMQNNQANDGGERGVIIHTASIAAYEGQFGQVAYSATKSALVGMILPTAREFARDGIRAMAIAPGIFETPMMDGVSDEIRQSLYDSVPFPSRFGKPEEFASTVQHIFENPMLNGSVIRLDGACRLQ